MVPKGQPEEQDRRAEGFVSIVGAGPGDPELITVKGLARLRAADVVAYDRLAPHALLDECRPDAELVYVGKDAAERRRPDIRQRATEELLVQRAGAGLRVVRLKGGDPFVFGRGGEEALALHRAGVRFEVIPGISSAIGVPAYAGVPVTHRGVASSFAVVTGHGEDDSGLPAIEWNGLARSVDTLVVLMGLSRLPQVASRLQEHGRPAGTPALLIERGTCGDQRSVQGTLGSITGLAEEAQVRSPATLVVGEVVRLREQLAWYREERPREPVER